MIIRQIFNGIDIKAQLYDGINILCGDSGTGKTLFMQALELFCAENRLKCTFINYRQKDNSEEQLLYICDGSEVVIIDNADLFITQSIISKMKNKIIVISLKDCSKIDMRHVTKYLVQYNNLSLKLEEI